MQRLTLENESLLRTMIHETVLTAGAGNVPRREPRQETRKIPRIIVKRSTMRIHPELP
jgi:hypothetical protein